MLIANNECSFEEKIRRGNIKARLRMIYLFDLAHRNNGMVLSTDNFTEFLLGFWTLHGDIGNYGMIQNLWKTEVYGLAGFLRDCYSQVDQMEKGIALNECINAVPTDGLGITDSDFDQLGCDNYEKIDRILIDLIANNKSVDWEHPVLVRHKASHFKRRDPVNISRQRLVSDVIPSDLEDLGRIELLKSTCGGGGHIE